MLSILSTSSVNSYWGVLLPAAEIFRRTLWGFLYLENETIKMMAASTEYNQVSPGYDEGNEIETNSNFDDHQSFRSQPLPWWLDKQHQVAFNAATSSAQQHKHVIQQIFLIELGAWAVAYVVLCVLVASR